MRFSILLLIFTFLFSCKDSQQSPSITENTEASLVIKYAEGFTIDRGLGYSIITITNPWPGAEQEYKYLLIDNSELAVNRTASDSIRQSMPFDAIVQLPVNQLVVTSTTHIPSLDMLGETEKLVGFPNLDYISSETARVLISKGGIKELGQNESINTEVLIDLAPDVVVSFAVDGTNKTVAAIQKTGIPVLYNADWTETHPLGKAEWIKFFGVLFGKEKMADSIFNTIENEYITARELAGKASKSPTVMSGAMYKDIWYMPRGNSWAAQFIRDAHGTYLWEETSGTGSLSMSLETVLEKAQHADFWIGPGQFSSLKQFEEAHPVYKEFDALQKGNVYTFTAKKGETGGVVYYELAPNRPDLVLKDIIAILHPDLMQDYEFNFFSKVE
jgi:iron complex transport system substrate-binding protein